jgi:RNA polymerase sigma-54 factor
MTPSPKLELRQSQSLVMTAQLQQSIKLLQYSAAELNAFVAEEIEKNPLLQEDSIDKGDDLPVEERNDSSGEENEAYDSYEAGEKSFEEGGDGGEALDTAEGGSWESGDWQESRYSHVSSGGEGSAENILEQTVSETPSLRDHLLEHLMLSTNDAATRLLGRHLIDLVDNAGYLPADYTEVAKRLDCDAELLEATVALLQQAEPAGICARNLAECMKIQLVEKDRFDPAMEALIQNLDLLAKADYAALEKICGVDREDLRDMVAEIKQLNPKPGFAFESETQQAVEPDVIIRRKKPEGWHIELNANNLPRVLVNQPYFVELSERTRSKDERKYLSEQLATANWLVKALDQRAKTLLKVTTEIVAKQSAFFRHGIRYLVPLTLREVADAIEMHESTVSRVTTNKFVATPRGMFELKYFFTSSVQSAVGGSDISSKTVQHYIQQLIEAESAEDILSDDAIAERLNDQGIEVARRTVAKYREMLNIPSSTQRRRQRKNVL